MLEGRQNHTLDMELFGPSSWLEGMYLLALSCAADRADAVGEPLRAEKYRTLYDSGKRWTDENLFNGEYFYQKVDLTDKGITERFGADNYWNSERGEIKYQIANGCFIDQLLTDWHAVLIGKEVVFDKNKKQTALGSLYKNNYHPSLRGLMLAEGMTEEDEEIIRSISERYDGEKRNPWNEMECGSNYARSMAFFALMPIYAGMSFDMTRGMLGFSPIGGEGSFLFSVGGSWGEAVITDSRVELEIYGDPLTLSRISLPKGRSAAALTADGEDVPFSADGALTVFAETRVSQKIPVAFA